MCSLYIDAWAISLLLIWTQCITITISKFETVFDKILRPEFSQSCLLDALNLSQPQANIHHGQIKWPRRYFSRCARTNLYLTENFIYINIKCQATLTPFLILTKTWMYISQWKDKRREYLDLRGTRWQGNGESCITRSWIICTPHPMPVVKSRQVRCGAYGGGYRCAQGVGGEAWGKLAIGETKT